MSKRYQKINQTMLFQQQRHHYEQIQKAKTTLKVDDPPRRSFSLYRNNKTSNERERVVKIENRKMLGALLNIYNHKQGILSKNFEEEKPCRFDNKRRSFYNSLKKEQVQRQIKKQNQEICYHLVKVEPVVGNHKEWNQHFLEHLKMEKRLCNKSSNQYVDFNQIRSSLSREKQSNNAKRYKKDEPNTISIDETSPAALLLTNCEKKRKKKKGQKKATSEKTPQSRNQQLLPIN